MSIDRQRLKQIAREARKIALVPAIVWLVYLVVALIFDAATERRGLVSPTDIDIGLLILGTVALGLRMFAILVLPAVVVYRLSARLLRPPPDRSRRQVSRREHPAIAPDRRGENT